MAANSFTLANGMQVLLEENHAARVVSFNALVKVGSASESEEEAGICHVIEHMLFKGTPSRPTGTIARDVEAAGGEINAYTSIDQTVFYINMATRFADRGLAVLADAILNPLFSAVELEREKEVILEEIRREQDNPSRMASENLFRSAFTRHPYGRPIIGSARSVKSFTRGDVVAFWRRWYSPKNIVLIAVGDFETKAMLAEIGRRFEPAAGEAPPSIHPIEEPPQKRPRLMVKEMDIQSAYLAMGFHIPGIAHGDIPALDVLSHILGGAESSRLEQEIKEKRRLVHSIYSYAFTPKDPGLFVIGAVLSDRDAARAIAAIRGEVRRMAEEPAASEELSRAKLNIRSSEIYERETVGGQASKLAYFLATAGDHAFEKRYYQMLADVHSEAVREACRNYLDPANCTATLLVPAGSKWAGSKEPIERAILDGEGRRGKARPAAARDLRPKELGLRNGARLIIVENHNLPIVSVCAALPGGTRFETPKTNGISGLTVRLLTKGTTSHTAIEISRGIEKIAGHIEGFAGRNTIGLKCEFLSDHLRDGLELFSEVLARPAFSEKEFAGEKRLLLKAIKDQEDALSSLVFVEFLKTLFPRHPYGMRILGSTGSVLPLRRADLLRHYRRLVRSRDLVIAVVGDVCADEVKGLLDEMLKDIARGRVERPKLKADARPDSPRESIVAKKGKQQAHIVIGFQGTTYDDPDRYAMIVLNNVMAGQGGRLFRALRDEMGLAYSVSSVNQEGVEPGYFAVYIGTEPAKQAKAIAGLLKELGRIAASPVGEEELERSKRYLVGAYDLEMQRGSTVAATHALNQAYGIPVEEVERYPNRILSVTREDVLRAAGRYIQPEAYTMAVVRPE